MERWEGCTVIVCPAHSRCGGQFVLKLLSYNIRVIALVPRIKHIETLHSQLDSNVRELLHTRECDLNSISDIKTTIYWIKTHFCHPKLLVFLLPKPSCDIFAQGNPTLIQHCLDACDIGASYFVRQIQKVLMTPGSGSIMWGIHYDFDQQDTVVNRLLQEMECDNGCEKCKMLLLPRGC